MPLDTRSLRSCLATLAASHTRFHQAEADSIEREIFRHAIIKGFELAQEIVHKLLRRALLAHGHGRRKLDETPVRDILRLAATHGFLTLEEVERWFAYRANRNDTAHDYGEGFTRETLTMLPSFLADGVRLEAVLRERLGRDEP